MIRAGYNKSVNIGIIDKQFCFFHYVYFCLKTNWRSKRPEVFCNKGVLKNFAKFTGKHLSQSLFFNKFAGLRPATLSKKRLWHRCFPVNFVKFLRTSLIENLWWLLLKLKCSFLCYTQVLKIECAIMECPPSPGNLFHKIIQKESKQLSSPKKSRRGCMFFISHLSIHKRNDVAWLAAFLKNCLDIICEYFWFSPLKQMNSFDSYIVFFMENK